MKTPALLMAVLALTLGTPGASHAFHPDTWEFQCMSDDDTGTEFCTTEILTSFGEREFIIYFAHATKGVSPLVIAGPEEPYASLTIQVDKKKPLEADSCEVGLCYFEAEKSSLLLKQFRKGHNAQVSISTGDGGDTLNKQITLRGFSTQFAKFGSR
jgi:hypothetical protein